MAPQKFVDGRRHYKSKGNKKSRLRKKIHAEQRKLNSIAQQVVQSEVDSSTPEEDNEIVPASVFSASGSQESILRLHSADDTRAADEVVLQDIPPSPPLQDDSAASNLGEDSEWEWGGFEIEENEYPPLTIENHPDPLPLKELICGRRIVNPTFLLPQLEYVAKHSAVCTTGKMKICKEVLTGLHSTWLYRCDVCGLEYNVATDEKSGRSSTINTALVWGALSTGLGHSQIQEMMSVLDVPIMSSKTFRKEEKTIEMTWEIHLAEKMKLAGVEEKRIAMEKGNVVNGVPFIAVVGDCGWAKRSYGHGYSSASGVGVLIGAETKKLLFLGVRNAFCSVCSRSKLEGIDSPEHVCYRNYTGPATGMEHEAIVEGFRQSIEQHGLIYKYYIGDGDSSTYCRIQERVPYGRHVVKIECANHITRAFSEKMHKLATNTTYSLNARRVLTEKVSGRSRIDRMVVGVRSAIKEAGASFTHSSVEQLRKDLLNNPHHVLGDHKNCRETYCHRKDSEDNLLSKVKEGGLFDEIMKFIDCIVRKADRVAFNETTNQAERFMGLVAKFTGGKRVNYTLRGSYRRRCFGAGLAHTSGPSWHMSPWKRFSGRSPGKVLRRTCNTRHKFMVRRRLYIKGKKSSRPKEMKTLSAPDIEYGPDAAQPDLSEPEMKLKMDALLDNLSSEVQTSQARDEIEKVTVGQHNNSRWREMRMNRLTASAFGNIMCRRPSTPCHNLVKTLLYKKELNTPAIQYGRVHEDTAIEMYVHQRGHQVNKCGLFIDEQHPFLGASPDGLVGDNTLVEVKCLYSLRNLPLIQGIPVMGRKVCMELVDNLPRLRRTHKYYYQVQGQLNICRREFCDFVVFAGNEITIERIQRDELLWHNTMLPKLKSFYMHCILPELADARIPRGMRVRDPPFTETQNLPKKRKTTSS